jgi:hypothetical protein
MKPVELLIALEPASAGSRLTGCALLRCARLGRSLFPPRANKEPRFGMGRKKKKNACVEAAAPIDPVQAVLARGNAVATCTTTQGTFKAEIFLDRVRQSSIACLVGCAAAAAAAYYAAAAAHIPAAAAQPPSAACLAAPPTASCSLWGGASPVQVPRTASNFIDLARTGFYDGTG